MSPAVQNLQKLKENEIFAITTADGDITARGEGLGLFFRDTRFLCVYELELEGVPLQLLASSGELNFMSSLQFTNAAAELPDGMPLPARTLSVRRNRFVDRGLHERIGVFNYNAFPVVLRVGLTVGSDFCDMFDVRNSTRPAARGWESEPELHGPTIRLRYTGLDGVVRSTRIDFDRTPFSTETTPPPSPSPRGERAADPDGRADPRRPPYLVRSTFEAVIQPRSSWALSLHVAPMVDSANGQGSFPSLDDSFGRVLLAHEEWEATCTRIWTDNQLLNALIRQSLHDLRLTINQTPAGLIPVAGIPWFSVPFGRDSLITSLQTLCLNPEVAVGTLRFLARYQGKEIDPWRDEEPGKILHELRSGELAALREVPHTPYYASIDATPLFLYLMGQLLRWTGDWALASTLRENLDAALGWMQGYGDQDGDGLLEYANRSPAGMRHQAWKDSHDAVQFPDGQSAEAPIAPVEVQAYAYAAEIEMARLHDHWGHGERTKQLQASADRRRNAFEQAFWMEAEGFYAQALDARKMPVRAITSNPGHCLLMGIMPDDRAAAVARRLLEDDMLSGWGIRTLSANYPTFNPMSYHNGSVWPHDNSLVVAGLRHTGHEAAALRVTEQILDAGVRLPQYRLPELYCGFSRDRRYQAAPAAYPTACSPQSWAAGAVFLMLQHMIGLEPDLPSGRLRVRPALLPCIGEIHFEGMRLGSRRVSIHVWREQGDVRLAVDGASGLQVTAE